MPEFKLLKTDVTPAGKIHFNTWQVLAVLEIEGGTQILTSAGIVYYVDCSFEEAVKILEFS